ncbi:DUF2059 domain-containing protein [uncultured Brevundimonas sp.]|uniref:DUF2059 domain-containing protein n=1 Tax=uncultured Brevundimonas sp. TaxID=213418 RepID=UPI0025CE2CA7|nr:DUF2059 domain-containing protein [uncultured Brevundimonas sp.]
MAASLGLALGLSATGAHAQAAQSETVVVARVEPAPQDPGLARELIDLSVGPNFMKEFERFMVTQMGELDKKGGEEAIWVRTNMPSMASRMIERFMDDLAPIYGSVFTEEELVAQIAFYRTAVGRSVAAKTISLSMASQEVETAAMTNLLEEFESKYCARFDCGEAEQTGAKPSRR